MGSQEPDPRPGNYYVSWRDGDRYGFLLGPFPTHQEALNKVRAVKDRAYELDPIHAHWKGYGTCRLPEDYENPPEGKMNELMNEGQP